MVGEVTCTESEKIKTTVLVENNTLKIECNDTQRWYEKIGLFWCYNPKIIVSLPSNEYQNLIIETVSGDVEASLLTPKNFITKTTSGKINVPSSDSTQGVCNVTTTNGDINISVL